MATDLVEVRRVIPRTPGGFPEYSPADQIRFNRMLAIVQEVYKRFGFLPLDTPAIEFTEVLMAKGGGESDKQIYRLFVRSDSEDQGESEEVAVGAKADHFIDTGRALRFDLTVPLARYVAQRQSDLVFPFRRYQTQKVWRGEAPQRGRFREFYQCDVDVIGTTSPLVDAEIPSIIDSLFQELRLPTYVIRVNNRKILIGIFESFDASPEVSKKALVALDKLEKIGLDEVGSQLNAVGFSAEQTALLLKAVQINGTFQEVESVLADLRVDHPVSLQGRAELRLVADAMQDFGIPRERFAVDLGISRGLDYYTGTVYETALLDYPRVGSVCSGGRYDNLAEYYTNVKLPGVGISLGLSRLFYVLKEIKFFQDDVLPTSRVMIAIADASARQYAMQTARAFRENGVNTEVYWEDAKLRKQLTYAQKLGVPFVAILGGNEVASQKLTVRNMISGEQLEVAFDDALRLVDGQR